MRSTRRTWCAATCRPPTPPSTSSTPCWCRRPP